MSVFEYKDGFRPRDQSVSTKLKYETEVTLWADAFKGTQTSRTSSIRNDLSVIGIFISFAFTLLTLVVVLIIDFIKWLRS